MPLSIPSMIAGSLALVAVFQYCCCLFKRLFVKMTLIYAVTADL